MLSDQLVNKEKFPHLHADCENCFGLCCVALPYERSADFPLNKDAGVPCPNLQSDYRCGIHKDLRSKGFRGCAVYEYFGAGQKVSQVTYKGKSWRDQPASAKEMFEVFPIMQQLHEMLYYLNEALHLEPALPIYNHLQNTLKKTENPTNLTSKSILEVNVSDHRAIVNDLLMQTSKLVRGNVLVKKNKSQKKQRKVGRGSQFIGANFRKADLKGANLRGAMFIASDLRDADMRMTDLIGADFRDADLRGANLSGSIFLTQAQVNAAKGDRNTRLPPSLSIPEHWSKSR